MSEDYRSIARKRMKGHCRVCPACNGRACVGEVLVTRGDVRHAKLYYLRNLHGKAAKIKELRED